MFVLANRRCEACEKKRNREHVPNLETLRRCIIEIIAKSKSQELRFPLKGGIQDHMVERERKNTLLTNFL